VPVIDRIRTLNPRATLVAYGLYAPLNEDLLRQHGVTAILGPEAEEQLIGVAAGESPAAAKTIPRLTFIQPDRAGLPALDRYAALQLPDGSSKVVGSTDATRGCKHRCRHCPIVPVYDGQFRAVAVDVVLADIRAQVEQGARHISFGDPDFFNGPTHARRIIGALHREFPDVTYDVIIKVEHLLAHRELLPELSSTGCLFVTSAVESVDDEVLARLEKGHTRADFVTAAGLCRAAGVTLVPTFVAFTPWTTIDGYVDLLRVVAGLDLVANVAPVQWGIRLLVTWESRLLELPDIKAAVGAFDPKTLTYPWRHQDPRVDLLQQQVMALAGARVQRSREEIFETIGELAHVNLVLPSRAAIPYMNEPWYC
ncbi:MAG TPA: radical SAM protein, partial [Vicinamibacterales bacterium]